MLWKPSPSIPVDINQVVEINDQLIAFVELMQRHKLTCNVQTAVDAYNLEFDTVNGLRMVELYGQEREDVLKSQAIPRLRMNPEPKPDRMKFRLLVRGDTEPKYVLNGMPVDSPTPMASSLKLLVALEMILVMVQRRSQ
jgi:hypothetical protein